MMDAIAVASKIRSELFDRHGIVASRLWAKSGAIEDMNRLVSEAILAAVEEEREAAAKVAEDRAMCRYAHWGTEMGSLDEIATAIRARKDQ